MNEERHLDDNLNPLGIKTIPKLLVQFAIPSIIAMVVTALYNVVDQLYIGHFVGMYGNAATNVALPLMMLSTTVGLLFGIGGATNFNLHLGEGNMKMLLNILVMQ